MDRAKIQKGPNFLADLYQKWALPKWPNFGRNSFFSSKNQNPDEECHSMCAVLSRATSWTRRRRRSRTSFCPAMPWGSAPWRLHRIGQVQVVLTLLLLLLGGRGGHRLLSGRVQFRRSRWVASKSVPAPASRDVLHPILATGAHRRQVVRVDETVGVSPCVLYVNSDRCGQRGALHIFVDDCRKRLLNAIEFKSEFIIWFGS